jgi:ribosomal protein S18 acetylase RimI-like enzyme
VSAAAADHPVRARLGSWPGDPTVAHLVLLDHHMVPTAADLQRWTSEARARGARLLRTGALFEPSTPAFVDAGFRIIDRLTLLQLDLARATPHDHRPPDRSGPRLRRLRPAMLDDAAAVDRRAFAAPWGNDGAALRDVMAATPQHRSRCVVRDGRMVAFAISGRAGTSGYVQRLAVDPGARRDGLGRRLVDDALQWMRRRDVARVLVNTADDNEAALALYRSLGFRPRPDGLTVFEFDLVADGLGSGTRSGTTG